MIPYEKSFLGLGLMFRIHGSPIWKAAIPGLMSTIFFILIEIYISNQDGEGEQSNSVLSHPYGVGVLISSISFLIVFRANYGYQRYWNACGDVHHMTSKWLDAVTHTGVFHMQQKHHDPIKPPSYFDHHDLNQYGLKRDREREGDLRGKDTEKKFRQDRAVARSIESLHNAENDEVPKLMSILGTRAMADRKHLMGKGRLDGGWGAMFNDGTSTFYSMSAPSTWDAGSSRGFASTVGGRTPQLFLQELVHLASLCNAVAYSTLRNDIEGAESPLEMYHPGEPWPEVDPDKDQILSRKDVFWNTVRYIFGFDRTPATRTKHNALRPLPVLGGVSDNEIAFLQRARGPSAKTTLAWHWLSEFIIREHLAGSTGNVAPPIISRLIQFLSDGMIFYNHARKTMFIPFPFPHAQLSAFFVFTIMFAVPLLMDEYSNNIYLGALLTFLTVTCLAGMHEVARELENPFRNVPNEIPLVKLQALFNESLITLFSGFHPDHFWEPDEYRPEGSIENTTTENGNDEPQASNGDRTMSMSELQEELARFKSIISEKADDDARRDSQFQSVVSEQKQEISRLKKMVSSRAENDAKREKQFQNVVSEQQEEIARLKNMITAVSSDDE
mmetsp:Transcript_24461/g.36490  ORF Transcript_24461/g.36490 Transcript_24461/m.36490 type:complete len:614 (-) Transcript_24461:176-2017(-)